MKFFLPVQAPEIAEESYQAIKNIIEKQTGWPISDKRYYEINYRQDGQDLQARVGGPDPLNGENSLYSNLKTRAARFWCALTAGVLCKINRFWPAMMRRPSSLRQKTERLCVTSQFQTFSFSAKRRMPLRLFGIRFEQAAFPFDLSVDS